MALIVRISLNGQTNKQKKKKTRVMTLIISPSVLLVMVVSFFSCLFRCLLISSIFRSLIVERMYQNFVLTFNCRIFSSLPLLPRQLVLPIDESDKEPMTDDWPFSVPLSLLLLVSFLMNTDVYFSL